MCLGSLHGVPRCYNNRELLVANGDRICGSELVMIYFMKLTALPTFVLSTNLLYLQMYIIMKIQDRIG